ncbi:MAG: glycosyltransferase family 4 protein [Actinobacteria bacterium]|nr:glycosyltransferase family 4 protein [Actinomycetota bacterium]
MRIALLSYRSKPHGGGQGVYVRHLSRELSALGHDVEVISGQPYPELDPGPRLTRLPSLDLYREPDPFRVPHLREFTSPIDVLEYALTGAGSFPEPMTFSLRAWKLLRSRERDNRPDIIHDNQTLGYGMLLMARDDLPVVATVHHPITVDRRLDVAAAPTSWRRFRVRQWYSFLRMQGRVVRRMPRILTVSQSSQNDVVRDFDVEPERVTVVPLGVAHDVFVPPTRPRVPGRIVAAASADVALKGIIHLLEATAKLRTERDVELVIVGQAKEGGPTSEAITRLGLEDVVRFVFNIDESELVELLGSAQVAVVPSLYEGFSLPSVEMMACATPLVATTAGALPEVVGPDGEAALLVPPADIDALVSAIGRILDDDKLAAQLGAAGRQRVLARYTWRVVAQRTADWYRQYLADVPTEKNTTPKTTTPTTTGLGIHHADS